MKMNNPKPTPIIIDFEASGLKQPDSYPIEVGVLKPNGDLYETLICPHESWDYWEFEAEAVHGIPRQIIKDCGKDIITVANELNEFIGEEKVYCDAVHWDWFWNQRLFQAASIRPTFNLLSLFNYITSRQMLYWENAKVVSIENFKENNIPLHRAGNDVQLIQDTFLQAFTIK